MLLSLALLFTVTKAGTICTVGDEANVCAGYLCDESYENTKYCFRYCDMTIKCRDGYYCTSNDKIYGECVQDTDECTTETAADNCPTGVCLISEGRQSGKCAECTEENQSACTGENSICIIETEALGGFCSDCTDSDKTNCGEYGECIVAGPGKTSGLCGCKREDCCDTRTITLSNNFDEKYNSECQLCICDSDGTSCYRQWEYQTNEWKKGYIDEKCGELTCEFEDYIYDDVVADDTGECCPRCVATDCTEDATCDRGFACNTDTGMCYTQCSKEGGVCAAEYGCKNSWDDECDPYECTAANAATNCGDKAGVCKLMDDSGSGFCCDVEAEVYRIDKDRNADPPTYQCKLHYCKQDGGDEYEKDDGYMESIPSGTADNAGELLTYLRKACPDVSECDKENLKFPTVDATNDNCCPICADCGEAGTCSDGMECVDEVCVATCDDDQTRNAETGECDCKATSKEVVKGVCVSVCGETESRDIDGNCASICEEGVDEDCDSAVNEGCVRVSEGSDTFVCQVTCHGEDNDCDGVGECVSGVCREECGDNETRGEDGNCACGDSGSCDDDQICSDGVCVVPEVKGDDKGGVLGYGIFVIGCFVFVMLTWM